MSTVEFSRAGAGESACSSNGVVEKPRHDWNSHHGTSCFVGPIGFSFHINNGSMAWRTGFRSRSRPAPTPEEPAWLVRARPWKRVAPKSRFAVAATTLHAASDRLTLAMKGRLAALDASLENASKRLGSTNPDQVLSRGYSLTLDPQGRPVRSASELAEGDAITTRLASGDFDATVSRIRPAEEPTS